jgi:hypothetical protein
MSGAAGGKLICAGTLNIMPILAAEQLDASTRRFVMVAETTLGLLAIVTIIVCVVQLRHGRRHGSPLERRRWNLWQTLVYLGFVASVAALGGTSLVPVLRYDGLHGRWLAAHLLCAGVFVPLATVMALLLSRRLGSPMAYSGGKSAAAVYWLVLVLAMAVIGTIVLSMFPFFGTQDMIRLTAVHRYSGLGLLAATTIHALLATLYHAGLSSPRRDESRG